MHGLWLCGFWFCADSGSLPTFCQRCLGSHATHHPGLLCQRCSTTAHYCTLGHLPPTTPGHLPPTRSSFGPVTAASRCRSRIACFSCIASARCISFSLRVCQVLRNVSSGQGTLLASGCHMAAIKCASRRPHPALLASLAPACQPQPQPCPEPRMEGQLGACSGSGMHLRLSQAHALPAHSPLTSNRH